MVYLGVAPIYGTPPDPKKFQRYPHRKLFGRNLQQSPPEPSWIPQCYNHLQQLGIDGTEALKLMLKVKGGVQLVVNRCDLLVDIPAKLLLG